MKIKKEKVVEILVGIGFKTAVKWPLEKVQKKVNLLHTIVDEDTTTNDDALDELLDEIISTDDVEVTRNKKKAKKEVEAEAEAEPEVEKEEKPEEKAKKKKDKSSTKEQPKKRVKNKTGKTDSKKSGKKPKAKEEVGCDKFGSKLDSDNAKVNATLSKKGKTVRQLTEKAGVELKSKYYAHLDRLIEAGHATRDSDGTYKLA